MDQIQSKAGARLLILDGLRGLSALAVVSLHAFHGHWPLHGYLAVDLFFLLSGYVVAGAYGERLESGAGFRWFLGARMARLYPLYVAGLALGLLQTVGGDPAGASIALLRGLVFLPAQVGHSTAAFGLNGAMWSLSLEIFVNLLYAAGGWRLGRRALIGLIAVSGLILGGMILRAGSADLGSLSQTSNYLGGFARVMFSFPLGVLVQRLDRAGQLPKLSLSPVIAVAACAGVYLAPVAHPLFDMVAILAVFPALFVFALGGAQPTGIAASLCRWSGRLSYPLYATHYPVTGLAAFAVPFGLAASMTALLAITLSVALAAHLTIEPVGRRLIGRLFGQDRLPRLAAT